MVRQSVHRLTLSLLMLGLFACGTTGTQPAAGNPTAADTPGVAQGGGDIPDNVVWLTYGGPAFTIQYPEGWVRSEQANGVTFTDKDSRVDVTIGSGPAPTADSVNADVRKMAGASITTPAHPVTLPSGPAVVVTYAIDGSPDPVTGKRPHLTVDRYEIGSGGRVAVIDLGAQVGVDNKDAYLSIAQSFHWK